VALRWYSVFLALKGKVLFSFTVKPGLETLCLFMTFLFHSLDSTRLDLLEFDFDILVFYFKRTTTFRTILWTRSVHQWQGRSSVCPYLCMQGFLCTPSNLLQCLQKPELVTFGNKLTCVLLILHFKIMS
jgi:hypothetical protein